MRIITARAESLCPICTKTIKPGDKCAHRPGYGWVHHPACVTAHKAAPVSTNDLDDLISDEDASDAEAAAESVFNTSQDDIRKAMGVPATAQKSESVDMDAIERRLWDELKRSLTDQGRLVKGMVKGEVATFFTEALPELLARITGQVKTATTELVAAKLEDARRQFKDETARAIARIANSGLVKQEITIIRPDLSKVELAGEVFHPKFPRMMRLAGAGKPIFIPGPTGCGKTHAAAQLARGIYGENWQQKFGVLSCSPATAERHFLGRSIPNITNGSEIYRAAEFVNIYENGGVFCADEIDAADASVLLVFNSALANGFLALPDRTDKPIARKHPDFVFVACANTWGRGADRRYVGRNQLDEATLDRFRIGTIPFDYSPAIERAVCPDTDLFDTLTHWRKQIFDNRLERVLSTRFFKDAYETMQAGDTITDITETFFSGWRDDEVRKVLGRTLEAA